MNELQVFRNEEFGEVRTVSREDGPWFVAADVCRVLEHSNVSVALDRVDEDEKAKLNLGLPGGETNCVSESGLYELIMGSRKPQAKAFKRWVKHDVLPSIRKHGAYMTPAAIEEALLNPDTIIQLATALKNEQARTAALEEKNAHLAVQNNIMAPKADYFDDLVDRNLLTNFRQTAKELKVRERTLIRFLLDRKYIYRDKQGRLLPYAQHVDTGLFEVKETYNEKTNWSGTQTLITPKGRETFRLLAVSIA